MVSPSSRSHRSPLWSWRKNRTIALSIVVLFFLFMAAFWRASGQPISALPRYFIAQQPIVSGYSGAMSLIGDRAEVRLFALAGFAALAASAYWAASQRQAVTFLLLLGVALALFLAFKEGFVRHDQHAMTAGAAALLGRGDDLRNGDSQKGANRIQR